MLKKVLDTISEYDMLSQGDTVLAAVSGGADSVCMLSLLCCIKERFDLTVIAAHFNHQLRGQEANRDELFTKNLCEKYGVEFYSSTADVRAICRQTHEGEEECGRRLRYEFFDSVLQSVNRNGKIATAHNLNDCMETFVMNMVRGATLKGLCSIPPVRGRIIRPLIDCSRREIESYCEQNNIEYVTDSTNLSDEYRRNEIRHNLIPELYRFNKSFDTAFLRMLKSARRENSFLEECAVQLIEKSRVNENTYSTHILKTQSVAMGYRVAAMMLESKGIEHDALHLEQMWDIIINDGKISLPKKMIAQSSNGILKIYPDEKISDDFYEAKLNEGENVFFDKKVCLKISKKLAKESCENIYNVLSFYVLDYDKINGNLRIHCRREGNSISLPRRNCTKSLKKLFNELKIPVADRQKTVVVSDDDGVVLVENIGVDKRVMIDSSTVNCAIIEIK